jgi:hypothetical protein
VEELPVHWFASVGELCDRIEGRISTQHTQHAHELERVRAYDMSELLVVDTLVVFIRQLLG